MSKIVYSTSATIHYFLYVEKLDMREVRRLINEPLSFGFFNKKSKRKYIEMKDDFKSKTADRMNINNLIQDLEKIKTFCETHVKSEYSDIFIELTDRRLTNSEDLWETINCLTMKYSNASPFKKLSKTKNQARFILPN